MPYLSSMQGSPVHDSSMHAPSKAITANQATPYLGLGGGDTVALLINNLGGTPTMELYICARRAIEQVEKLGARVARVRAATSTSN